MKVVDFLNRRSEVRVFPGPPVNVRFQGSGRTEVIYAGASGDALLGVLVPLRADPKLHDSSHPKPSAPPCGALFST